MKDTAATRWDHLQEYRQTALRRAIDCSKLTLPSLIPESSLNDPLTATHNKLRSNYQGVGSRGVSQLSAKLLLALYPPSIPFFRLTMDAGKVRDYVQRNGIDETDVVSKLDSVLSKMERQILQKLDLLQTRAAVVEALKHLLVGGNALIYAGRDRMRVYGLRSYCVDRDPEGNVTEIVLKEQVSRRYIPIKLTNAEDESDDRAAVYTHVNVDPDQDRVEWYQECQGKKLPNSNGFSRIDTNPWLPLRLHRIAGEPYGRSLVEDVINDLQSLESLSQAIVEGSLVAARAVALVNPNGTTRADVLARADNGAIVAGNAADVEFLQVQKSTDFSTALQTMQLIERRLQFAFLMDETVQRNAERVTAAEIRMMAESLERGLAGVYSVLSTELQLPLIRRVMFLMEQANELPPIPPGLVEPQITTGLEAIGRGNDKARLTSFLEVTAAALGPEQFIQYINPSELIRRFASADGIDTEGLVRTEEQLKAEQAQAQQAMLASQLTEGAIKNGATAAPAPPEAGAPTGAPSP